VGFWYANCSGESLSEAEYCRRSRLVFSGLMSTEANTTHVVRWEVLNGLPGEGPIPKHFHLGHPTPWAEGFVVRFWNSDGREWVGNFQGGGFGHTEIVGWPEASAVVVIATDNFYLVDAKDPANYETLGPHCLVSGAILSEDRTKLFVAEEYQVLAYGRDRTAIWQSRGLGGVIISIGEVGGLLAVEVEQEMGEPAVAVHLSPDDGNDLGTQYGNFMLFLKPWVALAADSRFAKFFEDEFVRELAPCHSLYGRRICTVAKNSTCDDVLFRLEDGTFIEVHLTFTKTPPEGSDCPRYRRFENLADWMIGSMVPQHVEHFGL
jgi:hypothetical protein